MNSGTMTVVWRMHGSGLEDAWQWSGGCIQPLLRLNFGICRGCQLCHLYPDTQYAVTTVLPRLRIKKQQATI